MWKYLFSLQTGKDCMWFYCRIFTLIQFSLKSVSSFLYLTYYKYFIIFFHFLYRGKHVVESKKLCRCKTIWASTKYGDTFLWSTTEDIQLVNGFSHWSQSCFLFYLPLKRNQGQSFMVHEQKYGTILWLVIMFGKRTTRTRHVAKGLLLPLQD